MPILLFFYRTALEVAFLVGCVALSVGYVLPLMDLHHKNISYTKHITALSILLVILMNDWKLTISAIRSGSFFYTLFYNTTVYAYFAILLPICSAIRSSVENVEPLMVNLATKWHKAHARETALLYLGIVFVTLYAPETTRKVTYV